MLSRKSRYIRCPLDWPVEVQEAEADRLQGLFRPLVEPDDGCAVHDGGELPAADPQVGPHRGEAESHLRRQKDGENPEGT